MARRHVRRIIAAVVAAATLGTAGVASAATYTVTTTADSGANSLRWAVGQANVNAGADAIVVADDVTGTIYLSQGVISITGPITITGPGADNLTLSATRTRIFEIAPTSTPAVVEITGFRFVRGDAGSGNNGGAIAATSSGGDILTLRDSTFAYNSAENGGAVATTDGTIMVVNSRFEGNDAATEGGAIWVGDGMVHVRDSAFVGNRAPGYGGGAIYVHNAGAVDIRDSSFAENSARNYGGALYVNRATTFDVVRSSFERNTLPRSGSGGGGAVYSDALVARASFEDVRLEGNEGDYGSAFDVEGPVFEITDAVLRDNAGARGVMWVDSATDLTLTRSAIVGNSVGSAQTGNAGVVWRGDQLTLANTTIADNVSAADDTGAALYVASGSIAMDGITLAGNGNGGTGPAGLVVDGNVQTPSVSATNTIIAGNRTTAGPGDCGLANFGSSAVWDVLMLTGPNVVGPSCVQSGGIADPQLESLRASWTASGQVTWIRPLLRTSPAWRTGSTTLTVDQRGVPRGAATDVGAVQMRDAALALTLNTDGPVQTGDGVGVYATVENTGDVAVDDATLTLRYPSASLAYVGPGEGATCAPSTDTIACAMPVLSGESVQGVYVPMSAATAGSVMVDGALSGAGQIATASASLLITGGAAPAVTTAAATATSPQPAVGTCVRTTADVRLTPRAPRRQTVALLRCRFTLNATGPYAFSLARGSERWTIHRDSRVAGRRTVRAGKSVGVRNARAGDNVSLTLRVPLGARWVPMTIAHTAPSGAVTTQVLG